MSREVHAGFCERRGVRFPPPTLRCLMVKGTKADAEGLREEIAGVLAGMGLRLSPEKTLITHIDEGLDFLALAAICRKVKTVCRTTSVNQPLSVLLHRLNPILRGWCAYFRPGVSSKTFGYLASITWRQVMAWLRRKHRKTGWKAIRRRYCGGGWWPADGETTLLHTGSISTTRYRYRYRGTAIPTPWQATG